MPFTPRDRTAVVTGLLAAAFLLRAPLTAVPPALAAIGADLGLSPVLAGLVTSLPLICLGVFAFLTPLLAARIGPERTLLAAVALVAAGMAIRVPVATAPFFAGTIVVGLGIAIGNVIVPAIVRARFADRLARMMGVYTVTIQVSAAAGAFATAPLLASGLAWNVALVLWLVPAALALMAWAVAVRRLARIDGGTHPTPRPTGLGAIARRPLAWAILFVMGAHSLAYYTLVTWIPAQLVGYGVAPATAGALLGSYSLLGAPGSLLGPRVATSPRALLVVEASYVVGLLLLTTGATGAVAGTLVCGVAQGFALAMALTFIAHQRRPEDVPAVSALAQGGGYLLASLGPAIFGAAYGAMRSFVAADVALACIIVAAAAAAFGIQRTEAR